MPSRVHHSALLVVALLVAQTAVAPAVAATSPPADERRGECVETRPTEPGGVPVTVERGPVENSVTLSVDADANQSVLNLLWIELPPGTTLDTTTGFERDSPDRLVYETVEDAHQYSLTYTFEENSTTDGTTTNSTLRPFEGDDEWAVAPLPMDYYGISTFRAPSEAAIGQQTIYFGNYSETTATNGCHHIRLIVPEQADLDRNRTAILNSLKYTDRHLGGQRYGEVTIFVSPENFSAPLGGVARNSDIVIAAGGQLFDTDARSALWLHEYVHTRQSYYPEGDLEWWTEASATYLSLRMGVRSGYLSPVRYNALLRDRGGEETADVVLANNSTWQDFSTYDRGVLALSRLDARLREDTNGSVTVASVFNATNNRDRQPSSLAEFSGLLENQSGSAHAEWSENYITGTADGDVKMRKHTPMALLHRYAAGILAVLVVGVVVLYARSKESEEGDDAE